MSNLSENSYDETGIQSTSGQSQGEMREAKEYVEAIVDTVREGLLVLDLDLRVVSASRSFYQIFQVRPDETLGRLVYQLGNGQWDIPDLRELLEEILPASEVFDGYEVEHDFEQVGRRIMLLNARQVKKHELILLAIEDVTERSRVKKVKQLVHKLTSAEEDERKRIGHVLHEDIQQTLYGAGMSLRHLGRLLKRHCGSEEGDVPADVQEQLSHVEGALNQSLEKTQTLSAELSPEALGEKNLAVLFRWVGRHMRERHGLSVDVDVWEGVYVGSRDVRALLLRVVRELLFNVVKHAETDRARLTAGVEEKGGLVVQVSDEGKGFEKSKAKDQFASGYGFAHLSERLRFLGGQVEVKSAPGEGTSVTISLPGSFGKGAER